MMENKLPKGWAETVLGEIADWGSGGTPRSTEPKYYNGDIPWLIIGDLNDGEIITSQKSITKLGLENSSSKIVKVDSILCAMYGSIGKLGITKIICATNQAIAFTEKIHGGIPNKFPYYYLYSLKQYLLDIGKGGAQQNISQTVLKSVTIPLPPLPEQHRIVAKLDAIFEKIESNKQRLEKIPKLLKRFRQSVLAAAVSGKLTEDWRVKNEILGEWEEKTLNKVGDISGGLTLNSKRELLPLKMPYLRVGNVYSNSIILDEVKMIGVSENEIKRVLLENGDLLIVEGNGSPDQIGRVAQWKGEIENCLHQNHLIKFRSNKNSHARYILYFLSSFQGRQQIENVSKSTSGLYTLSLSKVASLNINVPPLEEQQKIVLLVEQLFAYADKLEGRYAKAKAMLDKLPQSILAKAFRGELVAQDPRDEPASILLERIASSKHIKSKVNGRKVNTRTIGGG